MTMGEAIKYGTEWLKDEYLDAKDRAFIKISLEALEREPCEDCISRRKAIKMFTYNYKGERIPDYDCDNFPVQIAIKTVKEMLRELPPVTPKQRWIPVSERLPETNDDVLAYDGIDMYVAWYSWKGMWQGWNSSDYNFEKDTPIIAWMPLPKPYDPQESEEV